MITGILVELRPAPYNQTLELEAQALRSATFRVTENQTHHCRIGKLHLPFWRHFGIIIEAFKARLRPSWSPGTEERARSIRTKEEKQRVESEAWPISTRPYAALLLLVISKKKKKKNFSGEADEDMLQSLRGNAKKKIKSASLHSVFSVFTMEYYLQISQHRPIIIGTSLITITTKKTRNLTL